MADATFPLPTVIPAEAGIQTGWPFGSIAAVRRLWIPAFAGMTGGVGREDSLELSVFVIPAHAGVHGCGVANDSRATLHTVTMDPGVRRDDELGACRECIGFDAYCLPPIVIPAEAGIQIGWPFGSIAAVRGLWIPAFAGMTGVVGRGWV